MIVGIRGAGDIATGIAVRLMAAHFSVVLTDIEQPTAIRREVAFSSAIGRGSFTVEGKTARQCNTAENIGAALENGEAAVVADSTGNILKIINSEVIVDAILAKKNLGVAIDDAPLVIAVGPGFVVGRDCHMIVETKRGHDLGRVIREGSAAPDTGVPGNIGGFTSERIIRSTGAGLFEPRCAIGDMVKKGELVAVSGGVPVYANIGGVVRGMLRGGMTVPVGMKCGDIDPRGVVESCFTVSDKARAVGGGVLEAIMSIYGGRLG